MSASLPPFPVSAPRRPGLALPFALVGLAGGAVVADLIFAPFPATSSNGEFPDWARASISVVVCVTGTCAIFGSLARRVFLPSRIASAFLLGIASAVAGAFAGVASGVLAVLLDGVVAHAGGADGSWFYAPAGGYLGVLLSPAFWLPLGAIYFTWRSTGEARRGSILEEHERAQIWVAAACAVAAAAMAVASLATPERAVRELWVAGGATAALGVLAGRGVARLRRTLALVRGLDRVGGATEVPVEVEVDLGLGDERWVSAIAADSAYRSVGQSARGVRGGVFEVQGRLTRAVLVDGGLFAACLVVLLLAIGRSPAAPKVVGIDTAIPPPTPASTLPRAGVRWLSWYPLSAPILVDIDGDSHEDIVGLRWNGSDEARALSVTATNGVTLAPMWQSPPVPCQWANPQVRLLRSGERLFLADSESLLRVYDLRTGVEIGEPLTLPPNATMQCADEDGDSGARAWVWVFPKPADGTGGYLVDEGGLTAAATEPKWCVRRVAHPACVAREASPTTCEAYPDYRAPALATKFVERYALEENGDGVAVGVRRGAGAASPETETLVGFDPKTKKVRWDEPVAQDSAAHAFPRIQVDLRGGRVFTFFQTKSGTWELSARDVHTGATLWTTSPPRALEGTNFDTMTISPEGLYLGLSNRLEVFEPVTGKSRGVVW